MKNGYRRISLLAVSAMFGASLLGYAFSGSVVSASAAGPADIEHVRGIVKTVEGKVVTVTTAAGPVRVELADATVYATVVRADRSHITDGSFLGIASIPGPDGTQRALEVTIFPEAMRGAGEGSFPWDHPAAAAHSGKMTNATAMSGSKMTNGTAMASGASKMTNGTASKMTNGTASGASGGEVLTVKYKDGTSGGSQKITIPPGIPVVAVEPGHRSDLQPGVHVFVVADRIAAGFTALQVIAGKNGVVPPM